MPRPKKGSKKFEKWSRGDVTLKSSPDEDKKSEKPSKTRPKKPTKNAKTPPKTPPKKGSPDKIRGGCVKSGGG